MKVQLTLTAGLTLANLLLGFVVSTLMVWVLGAAGYGIYSYVFVISSILAIIAQLGVPRVAIRETARARSAQDWSQMRRLWVWATRAIVLASGAVATGAVLVSWLISDPRITQHRMLVLLGAALVPLISLGNLRASILQGLGKVVVGQLPQTAIRNFALASMVCVVWLLGRHISPTDAMGLQVAATGLAFLVGVWLLISHAPDAVRTAAAAESESGIWWRAAIFIGFSAAVNQINNYVDLLILGLFRPPGDVGIYRISYQLAALVTLGLQAVSIVFAPRFASTYATGDKATFQHLVARSVTLSALAALPVALILLLLGRSILTGAFGNEFATGYLPMLLLVGGQLLNASFGAIGVLMNMTRNEAFVTRALAVAALTNLVLNLILVPRFGMAGAATATLVGTAVWNVVLFVYLRRILGINSHALFLRRPAAHR